MRSRILAALAFALLFAALPGPDQGGGPYLGYLQVRSWLLDARASPLLGWTQDGTVPALFAEVVQSPTPATHAERAAYEALADEWAAARSIPGQEVIAGVQARGQLLLAVRIGEHGVRAEIARADGTAEVLERPLPSRWSLLPAVLAIVLALLSQRVLPALLCAGLAGSGAVVFLQLQTPGLGAGLWATAMHFFGDALWRRSLGEDFYINITLFVLLLFATVAITTNNGGFAGLVQLLQRRVRGPVGAQLCTFVTGIVLMFDDYTNCLVTGTAMRPLCDAMRVSRAKLAYLVDSTAAPIAGISIFSTWIAYEISQYRAPLALVQRGDGTFYRSDDAFDVFLASLPYRFYCLFALALVFLVIVMRRDLGPMARRERQARREAPPAPSDSPVPVAAGLAHLALLPLAVMVGGTTLLFLGTSLATDQALLSAAAAALGSAALLTRWQRRLPWLEMLRCSARAARTLLVPIAVLFFAWTLGHVTQDLGTSHYLTATARAWLRPEVLPLVLFLLAGLIAFATGTSFGTMAILLPNVVLLASELGRGGAFFGTGGSDLLLLLAIAAVLEGAIFGDHCSPISDTTLLSSLASGCDHVEHVVTQMPYALLAMAVSLLCGYLPIVLLGPWVWWLALPTGVLAMGLTLRYAGSRVDGAR